VHHRRLYGSLALTCGVPVFRASLNLPGITITLGPTDHLVIEGMRTLRATLVDGEGKWEDFGDILLALRRPPRLTPFSAPRTD